MIQNLINSHNADSKLLLDSLNKRIEIAEQESKKLKELIEFVLTEPSGDLEFIKYKLLKELESAHVS